MLKDGALFDEALSGHSTIRIGGVADIFAMPANVDELANVLKFAKEEKIEVFIVGAGSNVLFRDGGVQGIVISTMRLNFLSHKGSGGDGIFVDAGAGVLISDLVNLSAEKGVSGFEILTGIPGTIGGAVSMNAGTREGTVSDALIKVVATDRSGGFHEWPKDRIEFSYRYAKFPKSCAIISASFLLKHGSKEEIARKIEKIRVLRRERQPLKWPSLGSIFKNPEKGSSAGELIDDAGLKGVRVGGARISNEHGNWIINEGNATSKDVEVMIHMVREKVKESAGIMLEPEIVIVGRG